MFFSKLVLHETDNSDQEDCIRHYDIECEAVEMMGDIFLTKLKATLFKSFDSLKERAAKVRARAAWKANAASVAYNGQAKKKNEASENKYLRHFPSSTRLNGRNRVEPRGMDFDDNNSDIDESLSALMGKVRHLHQRFHTKNEEIEDSYSE